MPSTEVCLIEIVAHTVQQWADCYWEEIDFSQKWPSHFGVGENYQSKIESQFRLYPSQFVSQ